MVDEFSFLINNLVLG